MKNFIRVKNGLILGAISLLFASCSSTPESIKTIPSHVNMVQVYDVYSIATKAKLGEAQDLTMYKELRREFKNLDKSLARLIDEAVEDPSKTGIDFTQDAFTFMMNEEKDEEFFVTSIAISDSEKFGEFIDDFLDNTGVEYELEKEEKYSYILVDNDMNIGWDENKAVFAARMNYKSKDNLEYIVEDLLFLDEEDQITSNEQFMSFYDKSTDISMWMNTNILEEERSFKRMNKKSPIDLFDNVFEIYLSFNDNDISLAYDIIPNDDIKELLEKEKFFEGTPNADLVKLMPKQSLVFSNWSINKSIFEYISDIKEVKQEDGVVEVLNSIAGNMVYSIYDFKKTKYTYTDWVETYNEKKYENYNYYTDEVEYEGGYDWEEVQKEGEKYLPEFNFAIDITSKKAIESLIKKAPENTFEKKGSAYKFTLGDLTLYLTLTDNICAVSTNEKIASIVKNGGVEGDNLSSNEFYQVDGTSMYSYYDLDLNNYPKEFIDEEFDFTGAKKAKKIWSEFAKNAVGKQVDGTHWEATFNLQDSDENSLYTLIHLIDDNFKFLSTF